MTTLRGLINHLRSTLDEHGIPFVIGGAFALAARGHPRFTDDIDLMVLVRELERVGAALPPPRFDRVNEVTFVDTVTGLYVDVIPVVDDAQRAAFDAAVPEAVHGALPVRVLTAEGCALMLLREATIGDPKQAPLRLRDVELLAADGLDWSFVRPWVQRMGYEAAYARVESGKKPAL